MVAKGKEKARPECPRCDSSNTKFCYYNNYNLTQPRYFCKTCRRYWTEGGSLRNVPVRGGSISPNRVRRSEFSRASGSGSDLPLYSSNDPTSFGKYSRTGSQKKEALIASNDWLDAMKSSAPPRERLLQGSNAQVASIHYEIEDYRPLEAMKEHSLLTLPTDHIVNIFDENQVLDEVQEQGLRPKHTTFPEFCFKAIYCPSELRATLGAALYAEQLGQIWALGNPFDVLSQSTSTSKGTQASLISIEQAFSMFLPTILWSGMFLLCFIFATKLFWSLPFRVPMILMLLLSLAYYFSALAHTVSGFKILCGSITMPGLLFASGGAMGFVLLIGLVVMMVLWVTWCCIPNSEQQGKVTTE